MISLFFDTSSKNLTVYLVKDNNILYEKELETTNDHSKYLVPFIDEALKNNNIEPKDINKVYVVNGPGSFTGTRIGVTVGKTFCYSNNINVIPVSSLKQYIFSESNKDYNDIVTDKYNYIDVFKEDISKLNGNIVYISNEDIEGIEVNGPKLDIIKLIDYYKNDEINPHFLKPNYLKKIEVEEKL